MAKSLLVGGDLKQFLGLELQGLMAKQQSLICLIMY